MTRYFETGATRDDELGKYDYEAFLSPLTLERYGQYMHEHRIQPDGLLRDGDNWQKGIPLKSYMKSAWRHLMVWWKCHRGYTTSEEIQDALCGVIFNASGYLHELLKEEIMNDTAKDSQ